jgi:hypothetical protein
MVLIHGPIADAQAPTAARLFVQASCVVSIEVRTMPRERAASIWKCNDASLSVWPTFAVHNIGTADAHNANTATIAAGNGEADVNTGNNSSTTTDAVGIFADDFGGP